MTPRSNRKAGSAPRGIAGGTRGFTLAELVIAIGVATFCLVALVGMLPVGFNVMKAAREETAAAHCLEQIANSLRTATRDGDGAWHSAGLFPDLSWTSANELSNLSLGGMPTASPSEQRLAAHIEIMNAPAAGSPGQALISVAWPHTARWMQAENRWSHAQGSVSTWLIFLPER